MFKKITLDKFKLCVLLELYEIERSTGDRSMVKDASIEKTINFLFGNLIGTNYSHSPISLSRNQTTKFVAGALAVTTSVVAILPVS